MLKKIFLVLTLSLIFIYNIDSFGETDNEILLLETNAIKMINESKYEKALFYLDQILEIEPKNIAALNNKGGILVELGNYTDSIVVFNEILTINENDTSTLNNKAIALSKLNLPIQSLELFYKSLLLDPKNENTVNNTHSIVNNLPWIDETNNTVGVLTVRDQNGILVGYSEITSVLIQPPLGYFLLKAVGTSEEIEIDGVKHEILTYKGSESIHLNQYMGRTDVFLKIEPFSIKVVEILLNGFIVTKGDKVDYEVIIFDPKY